MLIGGHGLISVRKSLFFGLRNFGSVNKIKSRYNDKESVLKQLVDYGNYMKKNGFKIALFGHHIFDVHGGCAKYLKKHGFYVLPLYKKTMEETCRIYSLNKLIISMRGHGLMIPFGLSLPVISLTNQNKQSWFLETTGHTEWGIDVNEIFYEKLIEKTFAILNNYKAIQKDLILKNEYNVKVTAENLESIMSKL